MSLFLDWQEIARRERTEQEHDAFWKAYFALETENYKKLLAQHTQVQKGRLDELAAFFGMDDTTFSGFLDGINTSLRQEIDLENLAPDTEIALDIDYEKLYFNMLDAKADWLSSLPEWEGVLSEQRRREIIKEFRASKVFISADKVGRNDPCPCGSGKKYKQCCGKNA